MGRAECSSLFFISTCLLHTAGLQSQDDLYHRLMIIDQRGNYHEEELTRLSGGGGDSTLSTGVRHLVHQGGGTGESECVSDAHNYAVRCCSPTMIKTGWKKKGRCSVYGGSNEGWPCESSKDFAGAAQICIANGARLCTALEIKTGCTQGSGCGLDSRMTWTSTPCGEAPTPSPTPAATPTPSPTPAAPTPSPTPAATPAPISPPTLAPMQEPTPPPISEVTAASPCAVDSDTCLQTSPEWTGRIWSGVLYGDKYDCVNSKEYCSLWSKDMYRCCPQTCGVAPVCTLEACNALHTSGDCIYPNAAMAGHQAPTPPPTPEATAVTFAGSYVIEDIGTNTCSGDRMKLGSKPACRNAAAFLGKIFMAEEDMATFPGGCYVYGSAGSVPNVYWNTASRSRSNARAAPICEDEASYSQMCTNCDCDGSGWRQNVDWKMIGSQGTPGECYSAMLANSWCGKTFFVFVPGECYCLAPTSPCTNTVSSSFAVYTKATMDVDNENCDSGCEEGHCLADWTGVVSCGKCRRPYYLGTDGSCVESCPLGYEEIDVDRTFLKWKWKKTKDSVSRCEPCNGRVVREKGFPAVCKGCPDGQVSMPDRDECTNYQDLCKNDEECNTCADCLENSQYGIAECLNRKVPNATCLSPGKTFCSKLLSQPNCQKASMACYYKLRCQSPCICDDWKNINCGEKKVPANPTQCKEALADSCTYAKDDECDEPSLCMIGTDTTDCQAVDNIGEFLEVVGGSASTLDNSRSSQNVSAHLQAKKAMGRRALLESKATSGGKLDRTVSTKCA